MRDDHVLDKVQIGRRRATRCDPAKKSEHFRRKWIVAAQLAENGDEQDDAEIDAQDDQQCAWNGPRQRDVASICFCRKSRWRFKRCVHGFWSTRFRQDLPDSNETPSMYESAYADAGSRQIQNRLNPVNPVFLICFPTWALAPRAR